MMQLTKRESILIIILICVVFFYVYSSFIINPQILKIKELKNEIEDYELLMKEGDNAENTLGNLDIKYQKHLRDVEDYSKDFFNSLEQSSLILLLDKLITNTKLEVMKFKFSEYRIEELGENELNTISVSIPFKGSYESLLAFLKQIRENNKKVVIKNINILNNRKSQVSGNIVLDFYCIPSLGAKKLSDGIINKSSSTKENPFIAFEGYIDELFDYLGDYEVDIESNYDKDQDFLSFEKEVSIENVKKILLEGFEKLDIFFVGNPRNIEGKVSIDSNKKQGNCSLRFEYDFITQRQNSIANIVFDKVEPSIYIQPEYISILVYSYETSDHQLGLILKDALGKEYNILLADKIDWIEWSTLKSELPEEITYPAKVQRIYAQSTDLESKTNGVFLLDNMEVAYRDILPHSYEKHTDNNSDRYIE